MKGLLPITNLLLLLLLLLSPDPGEALLPPPPTTCCTQLYRKTLSHKLLKKVIQVELQEADGDCHLQAIMLHLLRRRVCIHPQNHSLIRWLERQGRRFQETLSTLNWRPTGKMELHPPEAKQ